MADQVAGHGRMCGYILSCLCCFGFDITVVIARTDGHDKVNDDWIVTTATVAAL